MKVSLNAAQSQSNVDLSPNGIDDLIQKIGAQLGAVEEVYNSGAKYDQVVVARVISCEKHPNADKLNICLIDDGRVVEGVERNSEGLVQVVCGAPNVRAGLSVAWLPPGAVVPSTYYGDKFTLSVREIRGVQSHGMIASPSELAISDDHEGILEIHSQDVGEELTQPGSEFKKLYGLDDVTIEIENKMFTHRPDCFGVLGVAREIAGIQNLQFKSPDWYLNKPEFSDATELPLRIENEALELVPRFMAVAMSNVEIKPSPIWLQALLTRVAIKPINNVVDVTNYLSYITAQPLHAYDYDKVKGLSSDEPVLMARLPKNGEKVALLNGKTVEPRNEAIVIATDRELVGIGGVMGGSTTEVDAKTKNIIIECANFDMYSIRRTSMTHGLFTDAVTRFNKGQSPLQNDRVIAQAMKMMNELTGGTQASKVIDIKNNNLKVFSRYENFKGRNNEAVGVFEWGSLTGPIIVDTAFINGRLGSALSPDDIAGYLRNVEINAHQDNHENRNEIEIISPFWRTDLQIEEDIIEEVGRLMGFDKLPRELPKRTALPARIDKKLRLKQAIRSKLASYGANEVLTYSFVHGDLLDKVGQDKNYAFKLINALSPDLQYYRLSLTPSLLTHVHQNIKTGHDNFALFEVGKIHIKTEISEDGTPREFDRVSLVVAHKSSQTPAYYEAAEYLHELLGETAQFIPFDEKILHDEHIVRHQLLMPYEPTRSALVKVGDLVVGIVGEFKPAVQKRLKLPQSTAGFEVFLNVCGRADNAYTPLSRFPSTSQDICLEVKNELTFGEFKYAFEELINTQLSADQLIKVEPLDIFTSEAIEGNKRITYRVTLTSYERTLTDEVLNKILDSVASGLSESHHARRI